MIGPPLEQLPVSLVPFQASDVDNSYLAWLRDPDVIKYTEARFFEASLPNCEAYVREAAESKTACLWRIHDGGKPVGTIKLGNISAFHGTASIALMIGEKAHWGREIGRTAIGLVCRHAFDDFGLRKIVAGIYASNAGSIAAFRRVGFHEDACLADHYRIDEDTTVDGLIFALHAREWAAATGAAAS